MTVNTLITLSESKISQIKDLIGHTLRKSGIDNDAAQLIIEQGGLFQEKMLPILKELAMPKGNDYADETVNLAFFYPKGHYIPSLAEQRDRLLAAFPGLNLPEPVYEHTFQRGFDGVAYHVFPERLGLQFDIPDGNHSNYGKVIEEIILPALAAVYKANGHGFYNHLARELGPNLIRLDERSRAIFNQMQEITVMDAFIAPVSLGQLWKPYTYSARNARETCFLSRKFLPQGLAQVGCHLVAIPDRLVSYNDLWIECPGDEYRYAGCEWECSPFFPLPQRAPRAGCRGLGLGYRPLWFGRGVSRSLVFGFWDIVTFCLI